ncbi:hypothetical protein B296_00025074 [Ensete ventricosum]|uniref:Uncharacterized protein n=1 Tax=Ensete ventricosum TaxID=4639 RepID=A0A426X6T7_ENSVE|nr:hypothetical protein B296_00025074 [Ensete ventricosum]
MLPGPAHRGYLLQGQQLPIGSHLQRDARKDGRLQGARKERPPVANPQGAAPMARATASNGSSVDHKSSCWRARATAACTGATTTQRGQEVLGKSFYKRMILPF